MFTTGFTVLVYLGLALATPLTNFRVLEKRDLVPHGFTRVGPASPEHVSDPSSYKYGQYLTMEEVGSFVKPSSVTKDAVDAWLRTNGLDATAVSPAGDWIGINVPVSKANALFDADFTTFTHQDTGSQFIRTMSYSLPEALHGHVEVVHPTVSFPDSANLPLTTTKQKRSIHEIVQRDPSTTCANGTIPACLQDLYQIPLTPATQKNNTLGVTGFFGNSAHFTYLAEFLKMYRPDIDANTATFNVVGIDGGDNPQEGPSVSEGELDIQYTVGLATNVNVTYYFIGIDNQDGLMGFLDEANLLLALEQPPLVLTTSYGLQEKTISLALTQKLCNVYAQLGARGTTILFASGDSGPGCRSDSNVFEPMFPSNCPYVTSVGGTQNFAPEEAWPGSSGGFSNYYARPDYQKKAVGAYLSAHGEKNAGRFNASGRAFPDIAAKADFFIINANGFSGIQGTSASSPTFASIVALINDRLLAKGRPQMGFLNPWLYSTGHAAFTDITTGNSSIQCSSTDPTRGFDAVAGWDPVTGFGTPNFNKLVSLLDL
ncbi:family S53 protease-like protein [Daedaleopsis nitida]|nr:family S53 protease-like protein [Daedaleopsis nitida]